MTNEKLNAVELGAVYMDRIDPKGELKIATRGAGRMGYSSAIREVAQPIADERDELREALEAIIKQWDTPNWKLKESTGAIIGRGRAVLDKYPKP